MFLLPQMIDTSQRICHDANFKNQYKQSTKITEQRFFNCSHYTKVEPRTGTSVELNVGTKIINCRINFKIFLIEIINKYYN